MSKERASPSQNWADYIDSLNVFRAPTPRLERSMRMQASEPGARESLPEHRSQPDEGGATSS